ncbi:hypothetical protein [Flavobacterium psychrotolerans]|uniref:Uncharacterized protein n=1 Tax=Flavobacterium psychrotolerans TaxID=2169410 RepID=A0A2U1JFY8_9FLAO|nr:hypothetical protein [Flavobacterium psychrotolerans]PWA04056.1 hypothetical protein DB895_12765 [Flavobacterium psychrotolerans]
MSNITENKLNTTLVAADLATITTSIATITAKLPVATLDEDQRNSYMAINVNNKIFVEDVITELSVSGAGIVPAFINTTFLQNDLSLFQQIDGIEAALLNLIQKTADLKRIAGHESYATALTVYKIYDAANQAGIPGAKQGFDKLKSRFDAQGRPTETTA